MKIPEGVYMYKIHNTADQDYGTIEELIISIFYYWTSIIMYLNLEAINVLLNTAIPIRKS